MYHAIGKEAWDNLPSIFQNLDRAAQLDGDTVWWCWTNQFPSNAQPGKICVVDLGISFRKSDNTFKKIYQPVEIN